MSDRERFLAIVTFAIVGFGAVVLLANKLIFSPAREAKDRLKTVGLTVEERRVKVGMERSYNQKLNDHVARAFGVDRDQASAGSRAFIMQTLERSGLQTEEARTTPISGTRLKYKAGIELGWNVTVEGSQEKITNLLFLLQNDPHLFRIDDVSWTPIAKSTNVKLQFKLVTLILDLEPPAKDRLPSLTAQIEDFAWFLKTSATVKQPVSDKVLRSDERKQYAMIATRDIFRPYIKKPPPPPKRPDPPPKTTAKNTTPTPPRPPRVSYALVGLPQFGPNPEVMVKDSKSGKTKIFKVGEDLIGGEIVMIDYRQLPLVKDPEKQSPSRVIVRVGRTYWAVELGDDLANKYLLKGERLPDSLKPTEPVQQSPTDNTSSDADAPLNSDDSQLSKDVSPSIDASTSKESTDAP